MSLIYRLLFLVIRKKKGKGNKFKKQCLGNNYILSVRKDSSQNLLIPEQNNVHFP